MKTRVLGKTGLIVSEIGFGGWQAGGRFSIGGVPIGWAGTSDEETLASIRRARELGTNFFDTSDIYGQGRSESLLGLALAKHRRDVVISTKVGFVRSSRDSIERDYSRKHIFHAIDRSLHRLRTDYLDLYQLHNPPMEVLRREDAQEALDRLQTDGKIRFWGISVATPAEGLEVVERGWGYTIQVLYNILNQSAAAELLPKAKEKRYGVIARVPLASGLLSGRYHPGTRFPPDDVRQNFLTPRRLEEALEWVDEAKAIVGSSSNTLIQAALRFVLANDAVSTTVPGARNPHQVETNASASGDQLPVEVVERLAERLGHYNFYEKHQIRV